MARNRKKIIPRLTILGEFKKFILRGNVIDLAVGVIIGGAFNKIVTSLVNDIIMPLLSVIIGQQHFGTLFVALDGKTYASIEEAGNAPLLKYGSFVSVILDFLIMGVVIFLMMKGLNLLQDKIKKEAQALMVPDKPDETAAVKMADPAPAENAAPPPQAASEVPTTRLCPYCLTAIHPLATRCPHCTSMLTETPEN